MSASKKCSRSPLDVDTVVEKGGPLKSAPVETTKQPSSDEVVELKLKDLEVIARKPRRPLAKIVLEMQKDLRLRIKGKQTPVQ